METRSLTWFFKNDLHVGEGGFCERTMYFSTVDFATTIPRLPSSPMIRGDPHVGLALDILRISSRISVATCGRPGPVFWLSLLQWSRNLLRCQAMTVPGFTKVSVSRHPDQILDSHTQRMRSAGWMWGGACRISGTP